MRWKDRTGSACKVFLQVGPFFCWVNPARNSGFYITVAPKGPGPKKRRLIKVTPRNDVLETDFADIWWVGDYSDKNGDTNGGYVAIHNK